MGEFARVIIDGSALVENQAIRSGRRRRGRKLRGLETDSEESLGAAIFENGLVIENRFNLHACEYERG